MVNFMNQMQVDWHVGPKANLESPIFQRQSPLDGKILAQFHAAREKEVSFAIQSAKESFANWSDLTYVKRGQILREACRLLESKREEFVSIVRMETGKSRELALGELEAAIEFGYLMAAHGRLPLGQVLPSGMNGKNVQVVRTPLGVCALIVSFNTPLPNYAWKTFPALISGNTAILKPSPHTPFSSWLFGKSLLEAGVPAGVFQVIQGDAITGDLLVNSEIDLISFTGSNLVGQDIAINASSRSIKSILELGGSNPFIVFKDADIQSSVDFAIQSSFSNSGQRCAAGSRIILDEVISDEFIKCLTLKMEKIKFGTSDTCMIGPVISPESVKRLEQFEKNCISEGATIIQLGVQDGNSDAVTAPKLILGLDPNSELSKSEIFGPIARVVLFRSESEALKIANSTKFGLTAAIWTSDTRRAMRFSNKVSAGLVNINGPTHGAEPNMPFGGFGASGNGTKEAGIDSLTYYSGQKVIATFNTIIE